MIDMLKMPKWNEVLLEIHRSPEHRRYCGRLCRRIGSSLTHIRGIVKVLAQHQLIEIIPTSKVKKLRLTEKGRRVSHSLLTIKTELQMF